MCQVLIDAGADIEMENDMGHSPLNWVCYSGEGDLSVVKMLVEAGAEVRASVDAGLTCLRLAAGSGHTETVRYLVGFPQVDVNHKDNDGYTAVLAAAVENHADVVEVLIDAGADIEGRTTKDVRHSSWRASMGISVLWRCCSRQVRTCVSQTTLGRHVSALRLSIDVPRLCVLFCACLRWM